jgi:hypothetical protein
MDTDSMSDECENGVNEFLKFAVKHLPKKLASPRFVIANFGSNS